MIREGLDAEKLVAAQRPLTVALHDMSRNKVVYRQVDNPKMADQLLLATAALPVIFDPVEIEENTYSDGGFYWGFPGKLLDNTPIKPLIEAGCDTIIVVCLAHNDLSVSARQHPGIRVLPIVSRNGYGSMTAPLDFSNEGARWRMDQGYHDAVQILQHLQLFIDNENKYEELWARVLSDAEQENLLHASLQTQDKAHTELIGQAQVFDQVIAKDDLQTDLGLAEADEEAPHALQLLALENTRLLNDQARGQIEQNVARFISENANNREVIENAAMDALAALSPVTGRANGLHDQGVLSRLWNSLTGNNQRVFAENDRTLAEAQFAALRLIAAVQEKGAITLEFTCALQNRINGAYREIAGLSDRHNQDLQRVYRSMARVYLKLRDKILQHDAQIKNLDRRMQLNEWLDHVDVPRIGDKSLRELAPHLRLACLINDFYQFTEGAWNAKELLTLQQMCINVGLTRETPIFALAFCSELVSNAVSAYALLGDLVQINNQAISPSLPAARWLNDLRQKQLVLNEPEHVIQAAWGYSQKQQVEPWSLAMDVLYHMRAAGLTVGVSGTLDNQKEHWLAQLAALRELIDDGTLPTAFAAQINEMCQRINLFKLSIPLIGKFSSGKSTLLNAWLGEDIQPHDLGPCTSISTEFHYAAKDEKCVIVRADPAHAGQEQREERPLAYYREWLSKLDQEEVIYIELHLHHPALAQHPDLVIVDTPGIESSVGQHEKALERYIGGAVAYILCVQAKTLFGEDERRFMLRQRQLGQSASILVCQEDLIATPSERRNIRATIAKQAGLPPESARGCSANPHAQDLAGFIDLLATFEATKAQIFQQRFAEPIKLLVLNAEKIIRRQLATDTHADELKAQHAQIEKQCDKLRATFSYEKDKLLAECNGRIAEQVCATVSSFLRSRRSAYVSQLRNGQAIGALLTADAKNSFQLAVTQIMQPILKQFAEKLSTSAALSQSDLALVIAGINHEENNRPTPSFAWAGPVLAAIAALVAYLFSSNNQESAANEKAMQAIENAISQIRCIVPGLIHEMVRKSIDQIEQQINQRLQVDRDALLNLELALQQDDSTRDALKARAQKALDKVLALSGSTENSLIRG
jgi:predicted acylesterase/phospholipase RssA/GTPase SAR1 family protein